MGTANKVGLIPSMANTQNLELHLQHPGIVIESSGLKGLRELCPCNSAACTPLASLSSWLHCVHAMFLGGYPMILASWTQWRKRCLIVTYTSFSHLRWLWDAMWILIIKPKSPEKAASALNCPAISTGPGSLFSNGIAFYKLEPLIGGAFTQGQLSDYNSEDGRYSVSNHNFC